MMLGERRSSRRCRDSDPPRRAWTAVPIAVVLVLTWAGRPAWAQAAPEVAVTQVKASNAGPEFVDPALGRLGEVLKRKFGYRSFTRVSRSVRVIAQGGTGSYGLANGMALALKVEQVAAPMIKMKLALSEGGRAVSSFTVDVRSGGSFLASVPWGDDLLVLVICPTLNAPAPGK